MEKIDLSEEKTIEEVLKHFTPEDLAAICYVFGGFDLYRMSFMKQESEDNENE